MQSLIYSHISEGPMGNFRRSLVIPYSMKLCVDQSNQFTIVRTQLDVFANDRIDC